MLGEVRRVIIGTQKHSCAKRIKPLKSLDADKGYTKEELRRVVFEECKAEDRIKVKNPEVPIWRTAGEFLKRAQAPRELSRRM